MARSRSVRHIRGNLRGRRVAAREYPDTRCEEVDRLNTGEQIIRIIFDEAQTISKIFLFFEETETSRSQEFVLSWLPDGQSSWREIVRQQFNFSPRRKEKLSRCASKRPRLWS
jgi:hypothetical protein